MVCRLVYRVAFLRVSAVGNLARLSEHPAPADQSDDQHDYSDDEQDVNQAACDVETEAQKPQDEQDYKDSPEHSRSPFSIEGALGRFARQGPV